MEPPNTLFILDILGYLYQPDFKILFLGVHHVVVGSKKLNLNQRTET